MVSINKNWTPEQNFWEFNPQLTIHPPFSLIYNKDKSKTKNKSSLDMWCIFFLSDPDPNKNTFYRIPYQQRLNIIKENYNKDFDETDEVIIQCLEQYPHSILTAIERSLKEEIDSMVDRSRFIRKFDYSTAELAEIAKLDMIRSKTPKLYDNYEKLQAKFIKQQEETRVRGGRNETLEEKNLLTLIPFLPLLLTLI